MLEGYRQASRRRRRRAERKHQRLDIQGLRMVAVLTVFANHLCGWPHGGFIGVDVFFVISGFLITGNLLRMAETSGNVSFRKFYWNRVRRIVPAATLVLIITFVASTLVFLPFRAHSIGMDAVFAFIFMSNWWFAHKGTDYFTANETVSPIQHYWSLSIEEQFYFVWPALIFLISLIVARRMFNHRMKLAGVVMGVVVAGSLGWAIYETALSPKAAYFNTFTRAWELGVGALLATSVGVLGRIPSVVKPWLSWAGLGFITAGLVLISDNSVGFPAPWALMPVAGSALVISAGVGGEPTFQEFLRNPVATYIGDFSYSLYLVHWPLIVILGAIMNPSIYFYLAVVASSFGLAIASYHFVENPLRRAQWGNLREILDIIRSGAPQALAATTLLAIGLVAYSERPDAYKHAAPPIAAAAVNMPAGPPKGPLESALQGQIIDALKVTQWPQLDPSMESVVDGNLLSPEVGDKCPATGSVSANLCTWGSPTAPTRIILVGDSVAAGYVGPLGDIANNSGGQIQLLSEAMGGGCAFVNDLVSYEPVPPGCITRKQDAVDMINTTKPNIVIISNRYKELRIDGATQDMAPADWSNSLRQIVDKFRSNTGKIVFLSPPPGDVNIKECYSGRTNTPPDCVGTVSKQWDNMATAERSLAQDVGGVWIDSRPWFCSNECPSFVGTTPTRHDSTHISPPYADKISPIIGEAFTQAGVF